MQDTPSVVRVQTLLGELAELLTGSGREAGGSSLGTQLTAWRAELDRVRTGILPDLPPDARDDLARRVQAAQARLGECLRQRQKQRRTLLVRLLSFQAAQNTLNCYRRPGVESFFSRTV